MKQVDILVIGGGASGLAAAIASKRTAPMSRVCICEKNVRVGKKLLLTGNGRCNLGNADQTNSAYHGSMAARLPEIMAHTLDAKTFFFEMGLYCRKDQAGRLYPKSNQATTVLDALRFTAMQIGVEIFCDCMVNRMIRQGSTFLIESSHEIFQTRSIIVATGGFASPKTGSDGSMFSVLEEMGHPLPTVKPALVPFHIQPQYLRGLKGIRIHGKVSACTEKGKFLAQDCGEIQFTEHCLSGICVMNLSAKDTHMPSYLSIDLLPSEETEQTLANLWEIYTIRSTWKLEDFLTGLFPKKVGISLLRHGGIMTPLDASVYQLTALELESLSKLFHDWRFPVISRGTWQEAQVTAGGIPADAVDASLQSKQVKGIFFSGEILDLHGECGGFNLEWAWRSGQYAGQCAAKTVN